jgi:two-component system nitrogen regulation response regulator GlnG
LDVVVTASSWSSILAACAARAGRDRAVFGRGEGDLGRLIEADGGTLFLDEIGDMPLDAQTRLLRVIDGTEPVVNPKTGRRPNVRIIAATNRDLRGLIQQGLFREDLFFRLNVAPVRLPPLRDRDEDIPDLARTFLLRANREGLPAKTIDSSALDRLRAHSWPGNVRELENLIRRMCALYAEELITARIVDRELQDHTPAVRSEEGPVTLSMLVERHLAGHFADQPDGVPAAGLYDRVLQEVERPLIQLTSVGYPRKPSTGRRDPRSEPQYPAQEDPGPRRRDDTRTTLKLIWHIAVDFRAHPLLDWRNGVSHVRVRVREPADPL